MMIKLLFITVCVMWATTWSAMSIAVETIPAISASALRLLLFALSLYIIAYFKKIKLTSFYDNPKIFIVLSIFYFAIPYTFMTLASYYVSPGMSAIIFANMPILIFIISFLFYSEKLMPNKIIGLTLAICSLSFIIYNEIGINGDNILIGVMLLITAASLHAIVYKYLSDKKIDHIQANAQPCMCASLILFMISFFTEDIIVSTWNMKSLIAVFYLGVVTGLLGIIAYMKLNRLVSSFSASMCFLVFPFISLIIDSYIFKIYIHTSSYFVFMLVCLGIIICVKPPKKQSKIEFTY